MLKSGGLATDEVCQSGTAAGSTPHLTSDCESEAEAAERGRVVSRFTSAIVGLGWRVHVLLVGVAIFTLTLSWITVLKYLTFRTYAWDLGIYNQAVFSTLFDHRFLYYTADLPAGTGGALFATHFSPILFILMPLYAAFPGPATLLVLQALALGAAAVPLYYFSLDTTRSGDVSLCIALGYLIGPIAAGISWYDFHPEAFIPITGFLFLFYFQQSKRWFCLAALLSLLATVETVAPFVIVFLLISLASMLLSARFRGGSRPSAGKVRLALACLAVAGLWLLASYFVVTRLAPTGGTFGPAYASNWSILGAKSIYSVIPTAILKPGKAWQALHFALADKLWYVLLIFMSSGFLFLVSDEEYYLPVFMWLALALLSNSPGYSTLTTQYPAYVAPWLYAGAATGARAVISFDPAGRLREWVRRPRQSLSSVGRPNRVKAWRTRPPGYSPAWAAGGMIILFALVASSFGSPLLPDSLDSYSFVRDGIPSASAETDALHEVLNLVPGTASVFTTNALFPELSSRWNAYVLPASSFFLGNATFQGAVDTYVNESNFVVVDFSIDFSGAAILLYFANLSAFGLRAQLLGAELYERGWTGGPQLWSPSNYTAPGGDMITKFSHVDTSVDSPLGPGLQAGPGLPFGTQIWTGPYYYELPAGEYQATLRIRVIAVEPGTQMRIDLAAHPILVQAVPFNHSPKGQDYTFSITTGASSVLQSAYVVNSNQTTSTISLNVSFEYHWSSGLVFDCAGWVYSSTATFYLYDLSLTQLSV